MINTGDVDRIPSIISPDYIEVLNNVRYPMIIVGANEHFRGVSKTQPDLELIVDKHIADLLHEAENPGWFMVGNRIYGKNN
jgi:hypothetical protein